MSSSSQHDWTVSVADHVSGILTLHEEHSEKSSAEPSMAVLEVRRPGREEPRSKDDDYEQQCQALERRMPTEPGEMSQIARDQDRDRHHDEEGERCEHGVDDENLVTRRGARAGRRAASVEIRRRHSRPRGSRHHSDSRLTARRRRGRRGGGSGEGDRGGQVEPNRAMSLRLSDYANDGWRSYLIVLGDLRRGTCSRQARSRRINERVCTASECRHA